MGLFQRAVETYACSRSLVGVYREGHEPLAPIGHVLTSADIEITLDRNGGFLGAVSLDKKNEPKIVIPVTEESAGRTVKLAPHPLCEQLKYLARVNSEAHELYLEQLRDWQASAHSHPMLLPILRYVEGGTILFDLAGLGIIEKAAKDGYNEKLLVRWRVEGLGDDEESACWKNRALFQAFTEYYLSRVESREKGLCMLTGEVTAIASQHPKGVIPINGNAKLISANDSSGFTYRGRFSEDWQAATVGYEASQMAHNALRWVAAEQGVLVDKRCFLCWNPQGISLPNHTAGLRGRKSAPIWKPSDYREALADTLFSFKQENQLTGREAVVLAAFDAATTGRLALTYYNELTTEHFLARMRDWDAYCCWHTPFGIQAMPLWQIVDCAYGVERGGLLKADDRIRSQHIQRLVNCKFSGSGLPYDFVAALARRASTPLAFERNNWRRVMQTACAALQKYRHDTDRGGDEMAWELDKMDRSFQYGRLLAVMDRAECDYYRNSDDDRQTNAIKAMSEFRRRPWQVYERINRQLHVAYLPRMYRQDAERYERLCGQIVGMLAQFDESELNKPLEDTYLMGYELQRNAFFKKKEDQKDDTETEEN